MILRGFHRSDLDELLAVERETYPKTAFPVDVFLHYAQAGRSRILVCEDKGQVAGYIIFSFCPVPPSVYVPSIAVRRCCRRRGIGTALVRKVIATARAWGSDNIRLHVRAGNAGAKSFYEDLGFHTRGRIPAYYPNNEDAYVMELEL